MFQISVGSYVNISGGEFGQGFQLEGELNLSGSQFELDGVVVEDLMPGQSFEVLPRDVLLTGRLADNNEFSLNLNSQLGDFGVDFVSADALLTLTLIDGVLLGDVNDDGSVDLLDVGPFVNALANDIFSLAADINKDGVLDLLDISPFVDLLVGG